MNKEEKENKLRELMKGCEGKTIYSVIYGNVRFEGFDDNRLKIRPEIDGTVLVYPELFFPSGACAFFPSEELYFKWPQDAIKAWEEWEYIQSLSYTLHIKIDAWAQDKSGKKVQTFTIGKEDFPGLSKDDVKNAVDEISGILKKYELPF